MSGIPADTAAFSSALCIRRKPQPMHLDANKLPFNYEAMHFHEQC
jgi:hypothetical protein